MGREEQRQAMRRMREELIEQLEALYRDAFEHLSKVSEAYLAFDRPPEK